MSNSPPPDLNAHPNAKDHWRNRRWMAWTALIFGIVQTILFSVIAYHNQSALGALGAVIGWSYGLCTFVLGSYYGNAGVEDYMRNRR